MDFNVDAANGIAMEGYLYKRASNAFKTWNRCAWSVALGLSVGLQTLSHPRVLLFQALVFHSEKPAGVSEEVQGMF